METRVSIKYFVNGCSIKTIICGVPQGAPLGFLLFLLYMNDLKSASSRSIIHSFADDANLIFSSKKLGTIASVFNNELKHKTNG